MRKKIIGVMLCFLLALSMGACGNDDGSNGNNTANVNNANGDSGKAIDLRGTYWIAYEVEEPSGFTELPTEDGHWCDVFFNRDGSVRLRNVYCDNFIYQDEDLNLTLKEEADGAYLYDRFSLEPRYEIAVSEGLLTIASLDQYGDAYYFEKSAMPKKVGELFHPAELKGTWQMVSYEIEGYEDVTAPGEFNTLVFSEKYGNDYIGVIDDTVPESYMSNIKSYRAQDYVSLVAEIFDENIDDTWTESVPMMMDVTILDEPLYVGCENDSWSVLLGEYSERDSNDLPLDTEYYVTMVDQNTLIRQMYFSFDGTPGASYQTYERVLPDASHWEISTEELEYSIWQSSSFIDENGDANEKIPGISEITVEFYDYPYCSVTIIDEDTQVPAEFEINWNKTHGGGAIALYMDVEDYYNYYYDYGDRVWFSGAVLGNNYGETAGYKGSYEMYLYHNSGFIKLDLVEGENIITPIAD